MQAMSNGQGRIAVTGVGLVTALGLDARTTMQRLVAGQHGFVPVTLFDVSPLRCQIAAQVTELRVSDVAPRGALHSWSRADAMAFLAAREALRQAALEPARYPLGLVLGTTLGAMYEAETRLGMAGRVNREAFGKHLVEHPLSASAVRIAETLGGVERTTTLSSACSSGALAILQAAAWIETRAACCVLAGGVDTLSLLSFTGFSTLGVLARQACRPFDIAREGLTLGEGAGFLVLEPEAHARRRGAPVIAWLTGWAAGAEAYHITHPEPSGETAARLMERALARAHIRPDQIDYVNAHGTGTRANDAAEAKALQRVLREHVLRPWVSSCKGQLGHTLGAAGAIEAGVSALALQSGTVPPTGGLTNPDPEVALSHVMGRGIEANLRSALSSSFGFGGTGAVLVFEHAEAETGFRSPRERRSVVVSGFSVWTDQGRFDSTSGAAWIDRLEVVCSPPDASPSERGAIAPETGARQYRLEGACHAVVVPNRKPPVEVERAAEHATAPTAAAAAFRPAQAMAALDPSRSRRFDLMAGLAAAGAEQALRDATLEPGLVGVVMGISHGHLERTVRFLERVLELGPRLASPAEFPHLMHSAATGNASVYLGLRGPALAAVETELPSESALAVAIPMIEAGVADAMLAGGVAIHDPVVLSSLRALACEEQEWSGEGGAWLVLESKNSAEARGARTLARLVSGRVWRTPAVGIEPLQDPVDPGQALVLLAGREDAMCAIPGWSGWHKTRRLRLRPWCGLHDASGALAVIAAVCLLQLGRASELLLCATAGSSHFVLHLASERSEPGASEASSPGYGKANRAEGADV